jgi:uracil-DNA glycosylase
MKLTPPLTWQPYLSREVAKPYFTDLTQALTLAYKNRTVYPSKENLFNAFELTPLKKVKVVILGQDPYHGEGQAHGLSFSVQSGVKIPPSLRNIYTELSADTGKSIPSSGNLEHWAKQGVFLLNSTLTVEDGQAGFHQGWGWERFTDEVIGVISQKQKHVVFLLWGKFAHDKSGLIDESKHLILKAPHPSPLSAHRGFFGCRHFSQTNEYLQQKNVEPICW